MYLSENEENEYESENIHEVFDLKLAKMMAEEIAVRWASNDIHQAPCHNNAIIRFDGAGSISALNL